MKTYTEAEVRKQVRDAITASKVFDAAAISRYQMSGQDAAETILKAANITAREIHAVGLDQADADRLCGYLKRR